MGISTKIKTDIETIFKNSGLDLRVFFKKIASEKSDKAVDPWKYSDIQVIKKTQTQITLIPRIKVSSHRSWLRTKIKTFIEPKKDKLKSELENYLDKKKGQKYEWKFEERVIGGSGLQSYIIEAKTKTKVALRIVFQSKANTNGTSGKRPDPHELMTACLVRAKQVVKWENWTEENTREKTNEIVKPLYNTFAPKIEGRQGLDGFYLDPTEKKEPDMVNFAKAISASNFIIDKLGTEARVEQVWQTGTSWAKELKIFNVESETLKNYNSSDIVVKFKIKNQPHYWGISLKKAAIGDSEPTLLNKPVLGSKGFLTKVFKIKPSDNNKILKAKEEFFRGAVKIKKIKNRGGSLTPQPVSTPEEIEEIDGLSLKNLLKEAKNLFGDNRKEKSEMLRGAVDYKTNRNRYFEEIDRVFLATFSGAGNKKFFKEFFDTIFKIEIDNLMPKTTNFHFSLITGWGDYQKGKLMVKPASEKWSKTTSNVFKKLYEGAKAGKDMKTPFILRRQKKKKQAFEVGSTAAKLFYEMLIYTGGTEISIVNLEVRYKGSLTVEPQFQVFLSVGKNTFNEAYKKAEKALDAEGRW